jgi:hypothetical protein
MKMRDVVTRLRALDQDATVTIGGESILVIVGPSRPPNMPRHYEINPPNILTDAIGKWTGNDEREDAPWTQP